jgi:type III secretion protein R
MSSLPDPIALLALIVAVGVLPFAALTMTCFTKLVVVLGLLRAALGIQQVPPNMVLSGLALILSVYIMAPVGMDAADALKQHHFSGDRRLTFDDTMLVYDAVKKPLKGFLEKHTKDREKRFFLKSAESIWPAERARELKNDDLMVLVPSFTLSELTKAFQIGFVIYLVFVIVDLVIANVLLALGMSMIAPTTISIPFKLLLFVMLDGWSELMHGLVLSYR